MPHLSDIARVTADAHGMLPSGAFVLALVSGGADSVALLRLLAAGDLGDLTGRLSVLHVNHLLRGAAADEDAAFVADLCATLGVPCDVVRYDVAAYAEAEGLNLEDAGRRVRYRFAEDQLDARCDALGVARSLGRIAVAHTADDRLETFLMRVIAGAGTGGLGGMDAVRDRIVRPLIDARRAEVTAYLESLGQAWREDSTNTDTARFRAWARHELLPVIEAQYPAFPETAARTMRVLAEEDGLLAELAQAFARDFTRFEDGALVLDRAFLSTLSAPMARRTVREAIVAAFPEASRLEFEHAEALLAGLAEGPFARDLPFGLRAEGEYARLRISRRGTPAPSVAPGLLPFPGTLDLGDAGAIEAREAAGGVDSPAEGTPDRVVIDADSVSWPLQVDAPRDGDRMRPFGMEGTKKLSDMLIDAKVPKRRRGATPVVRDGDRVVWLAGLRLGEECRVTEATSRIAELVWRPGDVGPDEGVDEDADEGTGE
jgi:tRNA(Ile)-lysidine synthase